ncbi:MAG TPA: helix-turn-helix domain-containing protein [Solirubrobacteraceae bacterium]|jgi:AcrR family transcriptional regulator|nr:helix-turn-helix domain-containing protein [Solirubrobacteraceae bacterium]
MSSAIAYGSSGAAARRARRASREHTIVAATRRLFDQRGIQDARVEDIARAAGLNKALIYRAFSSKDEIFALTATSYLDELRARTDALEMLPDAAAQLRRVLTVFADFCITYPAFLDCGLSLLRRPALELRETLSDAAWFRISRAVGRCVGAVQRVLEVGVEQDVVEVEDPGFTAGRLLTQMMGSMHLSRTGVSLQEATAGAVTAVAIDAEQVRDACVRDALAVVGVRNGVAP